jgi:L-ascorbate metabolism protein UlaG (beta-lactamase superfamily)
MDVVGLHPCLSLWLIAAEEEPGLVWTGEGPAAAPSRRYQEAASAQKIFYDTGSITQDLALEAAFDAHGASAPSVEEAEALWTPLRDKLPAYAFESEGDTWHIRNRSQPTFGDPLRGKRWLLFARVDGESHTHRVELEGDAVAEALAWLPLLDGHHTVEAVVEAATSSPAARRVFEAFEAIGALTGAPEEAFELAALPELLFVSHSSVFVRGREASVLIDPAILTSTEVLARPGRRPFELAARASAVLVSHAHWDHLAFQTMLRIPRETTIYVPRVKQPRLVNPPLRTYLHAFGFTNVVEVGDWDKASIGDLEVIFAPFFGEPFGLDSRFDAFTYLVSANGKTIYGSLDACHDEAGDMNGVVERLGKEHAIDVFLFGSSAQRHVQLYRAANMRHYSNELQKRPDLVRYHPDIDDVIRWCAPLRPKAIVPYANFVYFGSEQPDARLDEGSNIDRYWRGLEGRYPLEPRSPAHEAWRREIDRLAGTVPHPVVMLHPMQGLRL